MHAGTYPRPTSPGPVPACPGRPARDACAHRRGYRRTEGRFADRGSAGTAGAVGARALEDDPVGRLPVHARRRRRDPVPRRLGTSHDACPRGRRRRRTLHRRDSHKHQPGGHHLPTRRSGPLRRPRSTRRPRRGNPRLHRTRRPGQARRCGCEQPQVVPAQIHPAASGPWRGRTHIARRSVNSRRSPTTRCPAQSFGYAGSMHRRLRRRPVAWRLGWGGWRVLRVCGAGTPSRQGSFSTRLRRCAPPPGGASPSTAHPRPHSPGDRTRRHPADGHNRGLSSSTTESALSLHQDRKIGCEGLRGGLLYPAIVGPVFSISTARSPTAMLPDSVSGCGRCFEVTPRAS